MLDRRTRGFNDLYDEGTGGTRAGGVVRLMADHPCAAGLVCGVNMAEA